MKRFTFTPRGLVIGLLGLSMALSLIYSDAIAGNQTACFIAPVGGANRAAPCVKQNGCIVCGPSESCNCSKGAQQFNYGNTKEIEKRYEYCNSTGADTTCIVDGSVTCLVIEYYNDANCTMNICDDSVKLGTDCHTDFGS